MWAALFLSSPPPAEIPRAAQRARSRGKPIVIMHPGRSQARAHLGELPHRALRRRPCGDDALLRTPPSPWWTRWRSCSTPRSFWRRFKPPVHGPGIITNSGAIKGFALDFCDRIGLEHSRLGATSPHRP
jgi:hypothetical protein